jgi:hypothetical protein
VGIIYALSRRLLPSAPYTPGLAGAVEVQRSDGSLMSVSGAPGGTAVGCAAISDGHMRILGSRRNLLDVRRAVAGGMGWEMRWLEQGGSMAR